MSNKLPKPKCAFAKSPSAREVAARVAHAKLGFGLFDKVQMLKAERMRPEWADVALQLTSSDNLLSDVFDFCGLDPAKAYDWRVLINAMAEVCFKGPGRPQSQSAFRYRELLADIRLLQDKSPSLKQYTKLATALRTTRPFRRKYEQIEHGYLRKLVKKALDPRSNVFVLQRSEESHASFGAQLMSKELNVPEDLLGDLFTAFGLCVKEELRARAAAAEIEAS